MAAAGDKRTPLMEEERSPSGLPIRPLPGSYGVPFFSALRDRINLFYFQGRRGYFTNLIAGHGSTVFCCNMIPGPFMASHPGVVALLDAASFRILLDSSRIEKLDVVSGTFVPPKQLHGGYRLLAFLDTAEPRHAQIKNLVFRMLAARKDHFIPTFRSVYSDLFDALEAAVASSGKADFSELNDSAAFDLICGAFYGGESPSAAMGAGVAAAAAKKWILFNLHPLASKITKLPWPVEDLLLHTFHLPPCLVKKEQKKLEDYFARAAAAFLDDAERHGIPRDEALHNVVLFTVVNGYAGMTGHLGIILKWLAVGGPELHGKLVKEVRAAVESEGNRLTVAALEKMELLKSVVWEALRMDPPVEFQFGRARADTVVESHDAAYRVKKGQMLFGSQSFATRDERIFRDGEKFVADRFVSDEGRRLLKYVVWSNGPETEEPTANDKQCPGKDVAMLMGRLLVAELCLRYDSFAAEVEEVAPPATKVVFTSLTKSPAAAAGP